MPPIGPTRHRVRCAVGRRIGFAATVGVALAATVVSSCSSETGEDRSLSVSIGTTATTATSLVATTATGDGQPPPTGPADPADPDPTGGDDGDGSDGPDAGAAGPDWLGARVLPTTPDGVVVVPQTTPEELRDRRFTAPSALPGPPDDRFVATIDPVADEVLARSTWEPGCPVGPEDLAYLTVSFWGFDGRPHTGELLVNATVATDVVQVFERLHEARFPIEEMRVVAAPELTALPTGDGNNTTGFVCRPVVGGTTFSQHAYGLAVDINPFHNPYRRGDLILPELSGHYLDRTLGLPGMIDADGVVVEAFTEIGWGWGGNWQSLEDYHHFSQNGR